MIRFYIDGTTGQKDGTEVTSINPITAQYDYYIRDRNTAKPS